MLCVDDLNVLHELGVAESQAAGSLQGMRGGKSNVLLRKRN